MIQFQKIFGFVAFLSAVFFLFPPLHANEPVPLWNTYKHTEFSLQYPKSWQLDTSGLMGTSFILFSPVQGAEDKFRENLNLIIQLLPNPEMSLDQFTDLSLQQIKTMITNSKIEKSERLKTPKNLPFHHVLYTGEQGIYQLKFEQYYFILNQKAYFITFTAEQDQYNNYKDVAKKIMDSLVITPIQN